MVKTNMKSKNKIINTFILILFLITGCFSLMPGLVLYPRERQPANCKLSPKFQDYKVKNIAVLPLKPSPKTESGDYIPPYATSTHTPIPKYVHLENEDETAAKLVEKELLATFIYQPVDRQKLNEVLKELEFQLSDLANAATMKRVGNLTGADALLTGSVNQALAALQWQSYGDTVFATYIGYVQLELRLTDVETGDVIWICEIERNSLNYIDSPITIASTQDVSKTAKFGGPGENNVVLFVMGKAIQEAIAGLK
jgi:curli biogenesis system outer membrane secretion channel CsgG